MSIANRAATNSASDLASCRALRFQNTSSVWFTRSSRSSFLNCASESSFSVETRSWFREAISSVSWAWEG